ncbi:MAG: NAD(P)/FAD-dependent oxidoreductase [Phaeodactylibacter sp.]|nr:NAD(P)/FAD-dependent oxidoreductase [Phaeodactylibacter sp.]MCB9303888.1 NAD(P)/FAD-dependent oxidoreductase [Lewinellaceae bacterium]
MKHQIVIIGAGTAGITVAAQLLLKDKSLDIAIIDPASKHYYQPAWTLVGAGTYNFKDTERNMGDLIPKGAKWIQEYVEEVLPDENAVVLRDGTTINYDYLVACPGIQIDLDGIEGLAETHGKNGVCSNYTDPEYTWKVLQEFKGGNAIFTQPATPIKCGGAPQKIMYLADDYWRKTGVRKDSEILFITPGSVIFGVEPFGSTLMKVVDRKGIQLRFFHKITKIDGENKRVFFDIVQPFEKISHLCYNYSDLDDSEIVQGHANLKFDMLHLAPPQSAPDFIKRSKIAHQDGPSKGWINVNPYSLQHVEYPNVFSLGDAADLPTAKTGAAVRKQAPVVVENLLHLIKNETTINEGYQGYSSCPLVTGYGKMLLAEFNYKGERDSDPLISKFVDTSKEKWSMWILKKYGLPFMYWNLMLKGRA